MRPNYPWSIRCRIERGGVAKQVFGQLFCGTNEPIVAASKHGNTLVRTLGRVYGQGFAAGYPETAKLSEVASLISDRPTYLCN
jgi:hypothetical protein